MFEVVASTYLALSVALSEKPAIKAAPPKTRVPTIVKMAFLLFILVNIKKGKISL
jgi:hypothetical protein